eukprot:TRINITY_DN491_c0_g1_i2.p2 TRINITY_DN491_c0_g1~~TRINITY_DN491_c0_g1_i2.p2  ORF type:complete len:109 (+),score=23.28 TRINITY_DN491_c0_g1_i2:110-436(+)
MNPGESEQTVVRPWRPGHSFGSSSTAAMDLKESSSQSSSQSASQSASQSKSSNLQPLRIGNLQNSNDLVAQDIESLSPRAILEPQNTASLVKGPTPMREEPRLQPLHA